MADKQGEKVARTAKLFSSGLVPLCDPILQKIGKKPNSSIPKPTSEQVQKMVEELLVMKENMRAYTDAYPTWENERRKCIEEVRSLADNIDFHHRNINIANLPTAAVGIAGGVLMITGLALIPVTFGASLGLTITGTVIGVGSAATGITTAATDIGIRVDRLKKAKKIVGDHKESTENICKLVQELEKNCREVETMSSLNDSTIQGVGECMKITILGGKEFAVKGYALVDTIPKTAKALHLIRKGFGIPAAAGACPFRVVDVAADAAGGATKVVATTTGKVLIGFGFAFSAIGIVCDIVSAGVSIYQLAKGSKTSVSEQLREQVNNMETELKTLENIIIL